MAARIAEITQRRVGIELEVAVPIVGRGETRDVQELLGRILTNHGIPSHVRPYSRSPIPTGYQLSIEHDSSISGEQRYSGVSWSQIEAKTRPMTYAELASLLPSVLQVLMFVGSRATVSCGFHVHHDCPEVVSRPQVVRNLAHLWWRYHLVIYGLVAPSRKNNTYCRPPTQAEATHLDNCCTYAQLVQKLAHSQRHSGVNVTNLSDPNRRTVEWRIHGGTIDWIKVSSWVLATQRWVEHAVNRSCQYRPDPLPNSLRSLNSLLLATGLKPNSRIYPVVDKQLRAVGRYLLRRWRHFNQGE